MYNGGKNGSGVYQAIINEIPPHVEYIELFLGSGAIMRHKKKALVNIGIDIDSSLETKFKFPNYMTFYSMPYDAYLRLSFLRFTCASRIFIYADPPYLFSTRTSKRRLYKYEFNTNDHTQFLSNMKRLKCKIMISHYENELYNKELKGWRKVYFNTVDRSGKQRTECLYCNYTKPTELHDYSFLGENYTDRQRIRRKIKRHINKLNNLPVLEKNAIINALQE